jgi:hypothetical protein
MNFFSRLPSQLQKLLPLPRLMMTLDPMMMPAVHPKLHLHLMILAQTMTRKMMTKRRKRPMLRMTALAKTRRTTPKRSLPLKKTRSRRKVRPLRLKPPQQKLRQPHLRLLQELLNRRPQLKQMQRKPLRQLLKLPPTLQPKKPQLRPPRLLLVERLMKSHQWLPKKL